MVSFTSLHACCSALFSRALCCSDETPEPQLRAATISPGPDGHLAPAPHHEANAIITVPPSMQVLPPPLAHHATPSPPIVPPIQPVVPPMGSVETTRVTLDELASFLSDPQWHRIGAIRSILIWPWSNESPPGSFEDIMREHHARNPQIAATEYEPLILYAAGVLADKSGLLALDTIHCTPTTRIILREAAEYAARTSTQSDILDSKTALMRLMPPAIVAKMTSRHIIYDYLAEDTALQHEFDRLRATAPNYFADVRVFAHLHVLPSNLALLRCMRWMHADICILGKPHSTNEQVRLQMQKEGITFIPDTTRADQDREHGHAAFAHVAQFVANLHGKTGLLLSDGGWLLVAAEKAMAHATGPIFAVEQTAQGAMRMARHHYDTPSFPIVDVGRSHLKRTYESPTIGEKVVQSMLRYIQTLRIQFGPEIRLPNKNVLVIGGAGAVGHCVAASLKRHGFNPIVFDTACNTEGGDTLRARAIHAGFTVASTFGEGVGMCAMVISCTGMSATHIDDYMPWAKNDLLLFNGASGSHEISFVNASTPRDTPGAPHPDRIAFLFDQHVRTAYKHDPDHLMVFRKPWAFGDESKPIGIGLARAGFRINASSDDIRAPYMPTIAALFVGATQVMGLTQPGWHPLDQEAQTRIIAAKQTQLRDMGAPPLETPDFARLAPAPIEYCVNDSRIRMRYREPGLW